MKTLIYTSILAFLLAGTSALSAQNKPDEYLGLPGDNLNLFAVMNLFQESVTLESFEKDLNDPEKVINNLDLNGDEYVDYIMVFDYHEGSIHNIVLRVALNQKENQDVAVFIVEKFSDGSVRIQLIGDEALYGPNYIVEPNYAETPNPGYQGKSNHSSVQVVRTTYYEVAYWPVVEYIYEPTYVVWVSPWFWGYYHPFWHPWRVHYWHYYYGYHYHWHAHYYAHYRPWRYHRCGCYHTGYYAHHRIHSPTVVVNITNNYYSNTYSKPERVRDGQELFAQRHPNGIKEPVRNRPERTLVDQPAAHTKPMEANRTARTSEGERQIYNVIPTRPLKENRQDVRTPNDRNATDMNRINGESRQPVREVQPSKPVSTKPQATESREAREIVTPKPTREKTPEPVKSNDSNTRDSKPSVSRSDNSSSPSSSSSGSFGSSSRQSIGSGSSSGSSSVGTSSRQSSSSGSSSGSSSSGSSGSSSSSSRQSSSSVSSGSSSGSSSSSSSGSSNSSSSSSSSKSDDSKSSSSSPKRR